MFLSLVGSALQSHLVTMVISTNCIAFPPSALPSCNRPPDPHSLLTDSQVLRVCHGLSISCFLAVCLPSQ